ncbi:hypothetical protein MVEN_02591000 [Mycena venus]|uniref:Uncharacterized protein n=1 Tax=Mycena venus TaxID=2733690 RepID=A0A8H6TWZ3_9AGAR|nr:hypothetical protein MVEN_02591000 [Mycena venus]
MQHVASVESKAPQGGSWSFYPNRERPTMDCQISFGPNNAYFVKSDTWRAWSDNNTLPETLRRVLEDPNHPEYCQFPYDVAMAMEPGVYSMWYQGKNDVQFYEPEHLGPHYAKLAAFMVSKTTRTVFGPYHSYFSTSDAGLSWQNLPPTLETDIMNRLKLGRPHTVALGVKGAWVSLYDDSVLSHNLQGQYPGLQPFLDNAEERNKRNSITYVALSPYTAGHFFVAFGDGSAQWDLPKEMHVDVETVAKTLRPLPAAARPQADSMLQATLNFQVAAHANMAMNNLLFHHSW